MSSKNVYVSDADLPMFERAAGLAGGLSAAVAAGLRLYVSQQDRTRKGREMRVIELEVDDDGVVVTKRFTGTLVARHTVRTGTRARSLRVYRTARGQFAVYDREDPDWTAPALSDDSDAQSWDGDWWRSGARTLRVFADVDALRATLPRELVAAVERAQAEPVVEDLDI